MWKITNHFKKPKSLNNQLLNQCGNYLIFKATWQRRKKGKNTHPFTVGGSRKGQQKYSSATDVDIVYDFSYEEAAPKRKRYGTVLSLLR